MDGGMGDQSLAILLQCENIQIRAVFCLKKCEIPVLITYRHLTSPHPPQTVNHPNHLTSLSIGHLNHLTSPSPSTPSISSPPSPPHHHSNLPPPSSHLALLRLIRDLQPHIPTYILRQSPTQPLNHSETHFRDLRPPYQTVRSRDRD